jgi:hypothetical protein
MSPFEVKQTLDNFIYRIYNLFSSLYFQFQFNIKKILKSNLRYKDLHKDERCFILATGPSLGELKSHQIKALSNEVVFAVNSFYKVKSTSEIIPNYYVLMDDLYWNSWSNVFNEIESQYSQRAPIFITDIRSRPFINDHNKDFNNIFLYAKKYPVDHIDSDLSKNIFIGLNVVTTAILSAIYFGFKEIYILGADYNAFCSQGKGHAYNDEEEVSQSNYNLAFYLKFYAICTEFHYLVSKFAKKRGVKIINLNPNSLLDAYPKKMSNEILG